MRYSGIKRLAVFVLLTVTGTVAVACGGSDKAPPLSIGNNGSGGGTGTGGRAGRAGAVGKEMDAGDGGGARPGGGSDGGVLAPIVTITSPMASDDPNGGPGSVLSSDDNSVTVVCTAVGSTEPGAKPLDPSSVTLEMLDASGKSLTSPPAIAKPMPGTDDFSFKFVYTNVLNGKVGFRCAAKDKAGHVGVATVQTFVDHGPDIKPSSPAMDSAYGANAAVPIEFTVTKRELSSGDDGATVADVGLQINGAVINLDGTEDPPKSGHYKTSISPTDTQNLGAALNGSVAVAISATDQRGVKRTTTYHFIVDGVAPVVTITAPKALDIIGGKQLLSFTVTDTGSGVKQDTIKVKLNQDPAHPINLTTGLWTANAGAYTFAMDISQVMNATVQINVRVDATDIAGNSGSATVQYYVDTTRPIVDLDVPPLQELKIVSNTQSFCSAPFDPLGDRAVNDSLKDAPSISTGFVRVRGLSWDDGNRLAGAENEIVHFSGTDERPGSNPKLYYAPGDGALLVDSRMDGVCDDVDAATFPFIDMYSVQPTGTAYYPPNPALAIGNMCEPGNDSRKPDTLCNGNIEMSRVIAHDVRSGMPPPVIYVIDNNFCDDSPLQLATLQGIKNGWVCLAMRSQDKVGNVGVSAPLRVCLNDTDPRDNAGPTPDCAKPMSVEPPSCTNGCKPPPHFAPGQPPYIVIPR